MSGLPLAFNVYMDVVIKEMKMEMRFYKTRKDLKLTGLLFADDLVLCQASEEYDKIFC